jgi:hypothetical protein
MFARTIAILGCLLLVLASAEALTTPFFADSDRCQGTAYKDAHGNWHLNCGGVGCEGAGGNLTPCAQFTGGAPGASWVACGCPHNTQNPPSPICCYIAINVGGTPWGNGFCKDMPGRDGQPNPVWAHCPAGNDCNAVDGAGGVKDPVCQVTPGGGGGEVFPIEH